MTFRHARCVAHTLVNHDQVVYSDERSHVVVWQNYDCAVLNDLLDTYTKR